MKIDAHVCRASCSPIGREVQCDRDLAVATTKRPTSGRLGILPTLGHEGGLIETALARLALEWEGCWCGSLVVEGGVVLRRSFLVGERVWSDHD